MSDPARGVGSSPTLLTWRSVKGGGVQGRRPLPTLSNTTVRAGASKTFWEGEGEGLYFADKQSPEGLGAAG